MGKLFSLEVGGGKLSYNMDKCLEEELDSDIYFSLYQFEYCIVTHYTDGCLFYKIIIDY